MIPFCVLDNIWQPIIATIYGNLKIILKSNVYVESIAELVTPIYDFKTYLLCVTRMHCMVF